MSVPQITTDPTRQEVFDVLVAKMSIMFELEAQTITLSTHLFTDLDLDSIDAIDLAVRLEEKLGVSFTEKDLKSVQTLQEVVDLIDERL